MLAMCRYWREVADSKPFIWRDLHLTLCRRPPRNLLQLMRMLVARCDPESIIVAGLSDYHIGTAIASLLPLFHGIGATLSHLHITPVNRSALGLSATHIAVPSPVFSSVLAFFMTTCPHLRHLALSENLIESAEQLVCDLKKHPECWAELQYLLLPDVVAYERHATVAALCVCRPSLTHLGLGYSGSGGLPLAARFPGLARLEWYENDGDVEDSFVWDDR